MTKQWFVLHTLTGQELKVRRSIEARVRLEEMGNYIGEVMIPTEKVSEVKNGKKTTITRKFFPGYVLINLALYQENREVIEPTWRFLKETPGVIGFIGGDRPRPLADKEVDDILNQTAEKEEKVKPKVIYEPGESVKIIDGPFMSFAGTVDEVDPDRGKLKVSVAIFGRSAPVELEYWQVERADNEES
ncbi:MAG: transcription termination/antitermination protein NusG [Kiritimatiellae bacterium]|nr:transcription termination/antitermination protein NusG [Kiritimatiellia bacterium]